MDTIVDDQRAVGGRFVNLDGERHYVIDHVDAMPPFFVNLVSDSDLWMFVASNGGLTAGRVSAETALFPYVTVDKIYDSTAHTGCKTLMRVDDGQQQHEWEPFNADHNGRFNLTRSLYKNNLGNKIRFEETNHDLQLQFSYTWVFSDEFGLVRDCGLRNTGEQPRKIDLIDGLQNILPAGTPRVLQTRSSNLIDAYKWSEVDESTGLASFSLYSGITDRAEPCESLRASTVFCLGLENPKILLSSEQFDQFRLGQPVTSEHGKRGVRGAYLVSCCLDLGASESRQWRIVADVEQSQHQVVELLGRLKDPRAVAEQIDRSVAKGSDNLARLMAAADGFQAANEENVSLHHYSNVLFNVLRGGVFDDQYQISKKDFVANVYHFNHRIHANHATFLLGLPDQLTFQELLSAVKQQGDLGLERLCYEYLPITFGRRHGDPSRPWNEFEIKLKDDDGSRLLSYQGNWRDIFQNWEALAQSFPEFIENIIARFVNASTIDGYNPYRITKQGIDWEVEEPDDPWSYIGYWGDHQIIYLLKLLEWSSRYHPDRLDDLLRRDIFSYANVPYRIKPFEDLLKNPKETVEYDHPAADQIWQQVGALGADGKQILDAADTVYQVNLLEKLLVPMLSKLSNFVVDGGIWMNTQRPEWNDANNALVGQGLSMVTLYYLRRYICFLQQLLGDDLPQTEVSAEVANWLEETAAALSSYSGLTGIDDQQRYQVLESLGQAASRYRSRVYAQNGFSGKVDLPRQALQTLLADAQKLVESSIASNQQESGLFHAYNLMLAHGRNVGVDHLYTMLEGQVAALSSGAVSADLAVRNLEALFASDLFRQDQLSFMLYPDRPATGFLQKNIIPEADLKGIALLQKLVDAGDHRLINRDSAGNYRFHADLVNSAELEGRLAEVGSSFADDVDRDYEAVLKLYETVFNHHQFTGRSGGMFGFEGLGCIYWHMVSKLLLAVQENYFWAIDGGADAGATQKLGELYYRVREGIGFNKTPEEYGAFPTDAYSHTPKHAGASQPGMTGQVKEEILTRFGELGARVTNGRIHFEPNLLRRREFASESYPFYYVDVDGEWQKIGIGPGEMAYTWCQVPVVYRLVDGPAKLSVASPHGSTETFDQLELSPEMSGELFNRSGRIRQLTIELHPDILFGD